MQAFIFRSDFKEVVDVVEINQNNFYGAHKNVEITTKFETCSIITTIQGVFHCMCGFAPMFQIFDFN